jgi:hypothetical protein
MLLIACGSDDDPTPRQTRATGSAVLADGAKALDSTGLRALTRVSHQGELSELVFSSSSPILEELTAGNVLIVGTSAQTPNGALLKVESITRQSPGLIVQARAAALGEAYRELKVDLATVLDRATQTTSAMGALSTRTSALGRTQQALGLTFPISFSEGSGANRIELNGSLSIDSSFDLALDFDFASFELKELSLSLGAKETFLAELTGQGQSSITRSVNLGSLYFTPITLLLPIPAPPGTVPVVLTPRVTLEAQVNGSIQGEVQASVIQEAEFTAGLGYLNGEFGGFSDDDSTFDVEQPTYEAGANLKASAGPRLEVLLYGAVGPFAGVEAFVELAAQAEGPPPCATGVVDAGLTAKVGVDFLAKYETTLFDHRHELAQFDTCTSDPNAPRPVTTWARSYGRIGSPGETAKAVVEAADGTYLVIGESSLFAGITGFAASMWAMRIDALGNLVWQRAFGRTQQGLARAAAEVPGGFLVAGTSGVMKLDSGGNLLWARHYTADPLVEITSLAAHTDGSFIVAGFYGTAASAWAMKLDASGNAIWSRRYGGQELTRVRVTRDGGYMLLGMMSAGVDVGLTKLDADGNIAWARSLDNRFDSTGGEGEPQFASPGDRAFDIVEKPGGGYVLVGESYSNFPIPERTPVGYYATWIAEVDAQGEFSGAGSTLYRAPSEALYGGAYAVAVRPNGSALVVGRRADTATALLDSEDILIVQNGAFSVLGGAGNDAVDSGTLSGVSRGMPLQMTRDGGAILAATSNSFAGQDQVWLVKLNRTGGINFPYRTSLSGSSFSNQDATSSALTSTSEEVPVTVTTFTAQVSSETTAVVSQPQSP